MQTPAYTAQVHKYGPFEVQEFITTADFALVNFDKRDLDKGFSENVGIISYIGHMRGRAMRQTADFKTRRDAVKAKLSKTIRDKMVVENKKPTADSVDAEVRVHPEFVNVSLAENHAIEVEQTIDALYWAARRRPHDLEFFAQKDQAEKATRNFTGGSRS